MTIIDTLRKSDNLLLKAEGEDIDKWKKLDHNKSSLELFLTYNLAEIEFYGKDKKKHVAICSSNTPLIKVFQAIKEEDKKKLVKLRSDGIHTRDMSLVKTWDFKDNKFNSIFLKRWNIVNFINITPDNILLLDKVIRDLFKK